MVKHTFSSENEIVTKISSYNYKSVFYHIIIFAKATAKMYGSSLALGVSIGSAVLFFVRLFILLIVSIIYLVYASVGYAVCPLVLFGLHTYFYFRL